MNAAPRRNRAGEAARERILHAATARFARMGYRATTIADVAADIGMTDAGLLHHYPTKAALHSAILDQRGDPFVRAIDTPVDSTAVLVDRLSEALTESLSTPDLVRFHTMTSGEAIAAAHPLHDSYVAHETQLIRTLESRIRECRNVSGECDARSLAIQLVALVRGLRAEWMLVGDEIDVATLFRTAAADLVNSATGVTP